MMKKITFKMKNKNTQIHQKVLLRLMNLIKIKGLMKTIKLNNHMKIIKMDMKFKMIQKNQKRKIVIKRKMMIYKTKKQKDKKTLIKLR